MPDILPRDLELRSPHDLRTSRLAALTDTLVGMTVESLLSLILNQPPFGEHVTNPSLWVLLPAAIGARHGEAAGALAGAAAWLMHTGLVTTGQWPDAHGAAGLASAFLFVLTGAATGYLSGSIRMVAREELGKHDAARRAVHHANLTLRMAARMRDDLVLELFRARAGGSAVSALLRRVIHAEPARFRDELLEYIETVHEVKSAAVYRHESGDTWKLVTSIGAHPDGAYPATLLRGLAMVKSARLSGESVFAESPHSETELPLLIAPLVAGDSGLEEIVVVEDMAAERLTPRETLGVATSIEFFGSCLHAHGAPAHERFAATADMLLRLRRVCGVESTAIVFAANQDGALRCDSLHKRLAGSIKGRWQAARQAPALLIPGEHLAKLSAIIEEMRIGHPHAITLAVGFHEATDDSMSADEWIAHLLAGDDWII